MRRILAALMEHYDRLIVFVVLLTLFASLLHLIIRVQDLKETSKAFAEQIEALKPKYPAMAPISSEQFDRVMAEVREPFHIPAWSNSMFGPEKRIRCFECMKPIPAGASKCPFCLAAVGAPPPPPTSDGDGDGIPDDWERKYGLDPHNPSDAGFDTDADGFTSVEEFRAGTNPNDPNSHPDYANKARTLKVYQVPFKLRFRSHMKVGENAERQFQVNTVDNGKTYFVKLGDKVGEKGDEFVVEKFDFKEQVVTNQAKTGIKGAHTEDMSSLTLMRGEKRIPLVLNRAVNWPEVRAVVSFPPDGTNWMVKVGERVTIRMVNYLVMDIDMKAGSVVLRRPDSGATFAVSANGVVGSFEATRVEPEAVATEARETEGDQTP
jgi:hypothetical protein